MSGTLTLTDQHKKLLNIRDTQLKIYSGGAEGEMVREYIMNKLVEESMHDDPQIRLKALDLLGKLESVGAFDNKKKIVIQDETNDGLEDLLKKKLEKILGKPIEGVVVNE